MRVVSTAGHVDHGKSTLLRRLTGMEPDRWEQERRRGLTLDLGYVWTRLEGPTPDQTLQLAFVDVPGHEGYLANMLAGMAVVEDALLVVAADGGWSPQSQEHVDIIRLLGVRIVAVALTRCDLVDAEHLTEVQCDVEARLSQPGDGGPPIVAVSAVTGAGLDDLRNVLWSRLAPPRDDAHDPAERQGTEESVRLRVDRVFGVPGAGSIVTGMLQRGTLRVGDTVTLLPGGQEGRVRGLQQLGTAVEAAGPRSRVAVDLGRIPKAPLDRGTVLVGGATRDTDRATVALDVELHSLDDTVDRKGAWQLFLGTSFATVRLRPILGPVIAGQSGPARLEIDRPVAAWIGDRFVLREAGRGRTMAGGTVLDAHPTPFPQGTDRRLQHALGLESVAGAVGPAARLTALVDLRDGIADLGDLTAGLGAPAPQLEGISLLEGMLVRDDLISTWVEAVGAAARRVDETHAVSATLLTRAAETAGCPPALARSVVDVAVKRAMLHAFGGRYVHAELLPGYLAAREARQQALLAALSETPLEPPDPASTTAAIDVTTFEVQALLDSGTLVSCGPLLFTSAAVKEAIELLANGPGADGAAFTASEARTAWSTTRRCALPLLEHLQVSGATTFDGTVHRLAV